MDFRRRLRYACDGPIQQMLSGAWVPSLIHEDLQLLGSRAAQAFTAQPDIKEWANRTTLNPGRIPPSLANEPRRHCGPRAVPKQRGRRL